MLRLLVKMNVIPRIWNITVTNLFVFLTKKKEHI